MTFWEHLWHLVEVVLVSAGVSAVIGIILCLAVTVIIFPIAAIYWLCDQWFGR